VSQAALAQSLVLALELAQESASELAVCVGWVVVHLFCWVFILSADNLRYYYGNEGIRECGFDEA
jgi:hypothetical protein